MNSTTITFCIILIFALNFENIWCAGNDKFTSSNTNTTSTTPCNKQNPGSTTGAIILIVLAFLITIMALFCAFKHGCKKQQKPQIELVPTNVVGTAT